MPEPCTPPTRPQELRALPPVLPVSVHVPAPSLAPTTSRVLSSNEYKRKRRRRTTHLPYHTRPSHIPPPPPSPLEWNRGHSRGVLSPAESFPLRFSVPPTPSQASPPLSPGSIASLVHLRAHAFGTVRAESRVDTYRSRAAVTEASSARRGPAGATRAHIGMPHAKPRPRRTPVRRASASYAPGQASLRAKWTFGAGWDLGRATAADAEEVVVGAGEE
ncbi:hypothetical protein FB451DRAFT_1560516 [Mycena latifolia]|nr:hypothetical protein FB451DRAFT_1560516 [Mycena latifolia]